MSWSIKCTWTRIQSYKQAAAAWQKAVVFRSAERTAENYLLVPRGLVDRRKKHLTIERTEAGDFVLRLYRHPVVTWHPDNSITIAAPRSTISTGKFANHCSPAGMHVSMWNQHLCVYVDKRTYKVVDQITFRERDGTWKADKVTSPWVKSVVNRERAKQALSEVGYEEFRAWFKVYVQMAKTPEGPSGWIDNTNIVTMVRERQWRDLLATRFQNAWSRPDQVLSEIRDAIYKECGCIDRKYVPFLG